MTWESMSERERDAAIARKLGWNNVGLVSNTSLLGVVSTWLAGEPPHPQDPQHPYEEVPEWTTDPAAALGLLEEMRRRDYDYMIMAEPKGVEDNEFMVDLRKLHDGEPVDRHEGNADTLPAAICECVFRALADCPAAAQGEE